MVFFFFHKLRSARWKRGCKRREKIICEIARKNRLPSKFKSETGFFCFVLRRVSISSACDLVLRKNLCVSFFLSLTIGINKTYKYLLLIGNNIGAALNEQSLYRYVFMLNGQTIYLGTIIIVRLFHSLKTEIKLCV